MTERDDAMLTQVNYFHFVAEEIRAGLASLGMRSLDDLTGRSDLLRQRDQPLAKTNGLDLSFITKYAGPCQIYGDRVEAKARTTHPPYFTLHDSYDVYHILYISFLGIQI
jgi:hypothetical protein